MATISIGVGAAVLALWVDVRFPRLLPSSFVRVVGNALVALLLLNVAESVLRGVAGGDDRLVFIVLFALMIPALMYVFLAAIWVIRTLQTGLQGSSRW